MTNQMRVARGRGLIAMSVAALAALAAIGPGSGRGADVSAFDPGDIIVADPGIGVNPSHKAVKAVDPVTGAASTVSSAGMLVFPADVAFADDGDILVVDRDAFGAEGGIIRIDSVTAAQTAVSNNEISHAAGGKQLFSNPIALDRKGGSLYVTDFHKPPKVIKVNIETGKQSLVSDDKLFHFPAGIVAHGLKKPLVADSDEGVLEVNAKTGKLSKLSSGGKFPQALSTLDDDNILVADPDKFNEPGAIIQVNVHTGHQEELARGGPLANPIGVAVIDAHTAAVTDTSAPTFPAGGLYKVNLDTGDQTLLNGADFSNPLGIRIAP
jgi:sugar lactone lactonase YvrE